MFWTIVGALLFVFVGLPILIAIGSVVLMFGWEMLGMAYELIMDTAGEIKARAKNKKEGKDWIVFVLVAIIILMIVL